MCVGGWILPRDNNKKGTGHGSPLNYSIFINYHSLLLLCLEDAFSFQRDERRGDGIRPWALTVHRSFRQDTENCAGREN